MTFVDLLFIFCVTIVLQISNAMGGPFTIIIHLAHLHLVTLNIESVDSNENYTKFAVNYYVIVFYNGWLYANQLKSAHFLTLKN